MAKFLQDTLEEVGQRGGVGDKSESASDVKSKAYEFAQFARRVRTEGAIVTNEDIFKYAPYFEGKLNRLNLLFGSTAAS